MDASIIRISESFLTIKLSSPIRSAKHRDSPQLDVCHAGMIRVSWGLGEMFAFEFLHTDLLRG